LKLLIFLITYYKCITMKNKFLKLTILSIVILTLSSSIFLKEKNAENNTTVTEGNDDIKQAIKYVFSNLENAQFKTIREGWSFDYGFDDGGTLNSFEYIRSLMTYSQFQEKCPVKIFLEGPHTSAALDLNSQNSFGHYNPEFVNLLHTSINHVIKNKDFINSTRLALNKFKILKKLKDYLEIYNLIQENQSEFNKIKSEFVDLIATNKWDSYYYRDKLPSKLKTDNYWNWSETNYYFWVRRDIDGTKKVWHQIITDVVNAYETK